MTALFSPPRHNFPLISDPATPSRPAAASLTWPLCTPVPTFPINPEAYTLAHAPFTLSQMGSASVLQPSVLPAHLCLLFTLLPLSLTPFVHVCFYVQACFWTTSTWTFTDPVRLGVVCLGSDLFCFSVEPLHLHLVKNSYEWIDKLAGSWIWIKYNMDKTFCVFAEFLVDTPVRLKF